MWRDGGQRGGRGGGEGRVGRGHWDAKGFELEAYVGPGWIWARGGWQRGQSRPWERGRGGGYVDVKRTRGTKDVRMAEGAGIWDTGVYERRRSTHCRPPVRE